MKRPAPRLSRPIYEGLPWFYIMGGLLALAASYRHEAHGLVAALLGILGFFAVLGGIVVLLRRRDFRDMRAHYVDPDSPSPPRREE